MPHWLIKSAVHRVIALLPGSQKWNEWFQVHVTKSLQLGAGEFEKKVDNCRRCLDDFFQLRPDAPEHFAALELGTGWYPVVPLALYLCGAGEVRVFDIDPLLRRERLKVVLAFFCDFDARGALQKILPRIRAERMAGLRAALQDVERESPASLLSKLSIHVYVRDAQNTGLKDKSIDLFFSYSVLQYMPAAILANVLAEFQRLARNQAVMVHHIDLFDQFSRFDHSISSLNFLKYSDAQWRWRRSPLIPVSRRRIPEYRALISNAGFEILREQDVSAPARDLEQIRIAPQFQGFSPDELLVTSAWVVTRSAVWTKRQPECP